MILMEPVVIATGSILQLDCLVSGAPPPTVIWSHDGQVIDPTRADTSSTSLIINDVLLNDTGRYYCVATSTAGQVRI